MKNGERHGPEARPPFLAGQRVRCRLYTLNDSRYARTELYGRAATIVAVEWYAPLGRPGEWQVRMAYDHLSAGTMPYTATMLHRPEDLVPLGAWG